MSGGWVLRGAYLSAYIDPKHVADLYIVVFLNVMRHSFFPYLTDCRSVILYIQGDLKRWAEFRTSIFPELYMVCERPT